MEIAQKTDDELGKVWVIVAKPIDLDPSSDAKFAETDLYGFLDVTEIFLVPYQNEVIYEISKLANSEQLWSPDIEDWDVSNNLEENKNQLSIVHRYCRPNEKQYCNSRVALLKQEAEQGCAEAQFNLGWLYEKGDGVEQNWKEAVNWYRKAAMQNHSYAEFNLGVCYENGNGVVQDFEEAIDWYHKAAEHGCADAQCNMGWYYMYEKDDITERDKNEAVKWFKESAKQGCVESQFFLAECYAYGEGVEHNNDEAYNWYYKAAELGHADAQFEIGQYYRHGFIVGKDLKEAANWFRKAAEQGNAKAQVVLGYFYEEGEGVLKNYEEALKWYQKASEQGLYEAKIDLEKLKETIQKRNKEALLKSPYYLFFDTETTGVPKDYNAPASNTNNWPRLVQLGWLLTDKEGNELSRGNEIVKPEGFVIPPDVVNIHGITTKIAQQNGKPLRTVVELFLRDSKQAKYLVGHNVSFDQKIVGAELYRLGITDVISTKKSICTMKEGTSICKIPGHNGYKYPKLQELYIKLFGHSFEKAHDAMRDIAATKKCFFEMKRIKQL